jgi:photosystem II stability/assembly factor-like uncharacterized protein
MFWKITLISLFSISTFVAPLVNDVTPIKKPMKCAVRFLDDTYGWIGGCQGVFHTSDGGSTWKKQAVSVCSESAFSFYPGLIAWSDREQSIVLTEGGLARGSAVSGLWKVESPQTPSPDFLNQAVFTDNEQGWGTGASGIYHTVDGGKNWTQKRKLVLTPLNGLVAMSAEEVWAVGRGTALLHTADGGKTWEQQFLLGGNTPFNPNGDFHFVHFVNREAGWIGGTGSMIYHTSDGGKTWVRQGTPFSRGTILKSASFVNEKVGWVVGSQYVDGKYQAIILYTADGGLHWESQKIELYEHLTGVQALSGGRAWAVGEDGAVLRTVNYGKNWSHVQLR